MPTKHEWIENCGNVECGGTCPLCTLAVCKVCGLFEGSLTTECPGVLSVDHGDAVYNAQEDFINGRWARTESPHSPNSGQTPGLYSMK